MSSKIVCVIGPTGTGKTRLGAELAAIYGGEVVSADSMQIYIGMDVGTAKPTKDEMLGIPHHMIDIVKPEENYSVARYVEDASKIVDNIISRGKLPIIVGGTGLYVDSLISGTTFAPNEEDGVLRTRLQKEAEENGTDSLYQKLKKYDPQSAERLHPNDRKRIIRALEIYLKTGCTITEHNLKKKNPKYSALKIGLNYSEREDLYKQINKRVDKMIEDGLYKEVEGLIKRGLSLKNTSMQAIGYKEMFAAVTGEISLNEAVELIKLNTRRYAKRQLTWFRRDEGTKWINWEKHPDFRAGIQISTEYLRDSCII